MSISSRHHYIPQFYLKGFTNDTGKFAIFDIRKGTLKSDLFVPKSHFFEFDRNTLEINGERTDFIEKSYQQLEDKTKAVFEELRKAESHIDLTATKIFDLQLFILYTYWRIPRTDGELNTILTSSNFNDYCFSILNTKSGEHAPKERVEELLETNGFIEGLRPIMPILQFIKSNDNEDKDLENWKIYFSSGDGTNITGDNPIVLRDSSQRNLLSTELILPLTKRQVLIRSKNKLITKNLPPEFVIKLHMLIFLQSSLYVCGKNPDYLKSIAELCKNTKESIEQIKFSLFEYLDAEIS